MAYFYYPLSSKDFTFENIFSSESVSPPFFYEKRGFGIGYFNVITNINKNSAIILYSNPPKFEIENGIKFILQIDESSLDMDNLIFINEGVFAYQKTIYLNNNNFYINFFSEKDKKITVLKAETSLPTKNLDKYAENFRVISEDICVQYTLSNWQIEINDFNSKNQMLADKKYNQFKGFIYGIASGLYDKKSKEVVLFRKLIREIVNSFGELKSRAVDTKSFYNKNIQDKNKNSENIIYSNNLLNLIKYSEQAYFDFFANHDFNEDDLAKILLRKINRLNSIQEAKLFLNYIQIEDEIFRTNRFEELKRIYSKEYSSLDNNIHLELLKRQMGIFIDEITYGNNKSKVNLNELNNDIKTTLYELDQSISTISREKNSKEEFSLSGIEYDFEKNEIAINDNFQNLDNKELKDMTLIINAILKFSENNKKLPQKDSILQIVKHVGSIFSKDGKETLLYQYLNNEVDKYEFEKISNSVMKNFVAFIFNIESLEKLERFIDSKNVEKEWMAYSFWGSFNGFANLSGNFTKSIFSKAGSSMQVYLDNYLNKYIEALKKTNLQDDNLHYLEEESSIYISPPLTNQIERFYQKFVAGKYKLSIEEFEQIVSIENKEKFYYNAKTKFKINKKDSEKLFNSIKRDFNSLLFN